MTAISIVIVNWNTKDLLRKCLSSIFAQTKDLCYEIWVVDNDSCDGSREMVIADFPSVRLLINKKNVGFAKANNQAILLSSGRYVLLLNSDTEIIGDAICQMVSFMDQQKTVGIAGCRLLNEDGSFQRSARSYSSFLISITFPSGLHEFLHINLLKKQILRIAEIIFPSHVQHSKHDNVSFPDWIVGACMLIRREAFLKVGLLDENFFMYSEDEDLCYRMKQFGWKIAYIPTVSIFHYGGSSSNQNRNSMNIEFWKSRIFLFMKHYGRKKAKILHIAILAGTGISILLSMPLIIFNWERSKERYAMLFSLIKASRKK